MKHHTFSIIIPAFNEENWIAHCLKSLKKQDYRGDFEIIVVDNASSDKTSQIANKLGAKVFFEPRKGISNALIKGVKAAQGEIFAFIDSDTIANPNWLEKINKIFEEDEKVVAAGGPYSFYDANFFINFFTRRIVVPLYRKILYQRWKGLPGANMAVKEDAYKKSGGFNPQMNFGQDLELSRRLAKFGKVVFDYSLSVKTSFRRYNGSLAKSIKELSIQIYKCHKIVTRNKIYPAQKDIRNFEKRG